MVVASDGVYDNLYDEDVLECINKPESLGEGQFNHQFAADCLRKYTSPSNANPLNIAVSGCALIKDFIVEIENIHQCLKECNKLTLGTEDLLASTANDYEGYLYKMKQRIKGCIQ